MSVAILAQVGCFRLSNHSPIVFANVIVTPPLLFFVMNTAPAEHIFVRRLRLDGWLVASRYRGQATARNVGMYMSRLTGEERNNLMVLLCHEVPPGAVAFMGGVLRAYHQERDRLFHHTRRSMWMGRTVIADMEGMIH